MFEFHRLYCPCAKLHAPFPFDGLLVPSSQIFNPEYQCWNRFLKGNISVSLVFSRGRVYIMSSSSVERRLKMSSLRLLRRFTRIFRMESKSLLVHFLFLFTQGKLNRLVASFVQWGVQSHQVSLCVKSGTLFGHHFQLCQQELSTSWSGTAFHSMHSITLAFLLIPTMTHGYMP